MSHDSEIFSDVFAHRENLISQIEVRTKISFTAAALIINLLSPGIFAPLGSTIFCLISIYIARVPMRLATLRLIMPLIMAGVVLITQLFLNGTIPLFSISLGRFVVTGYQEGLASGLLIMSRVLAGASLVLFLSMTTPTNKLLAAAAWLKTPNILVEITLLMYRYIFVLIEEMATMREAQKVRLGYRNWRQSISSLSLLGGSLIIRAYDRAERVFQAMLVRGYDNNISVSYREKFGTYDVLIAVALCGLLSVFYIVGQMRI
jgi:cobalt/nickel transport system permease protein